MESAIVEFMFNTLCNDCTISTVLLFDILFLLSLLLRSSISVAEELISSVSVLSVHLHIIKHFCFIICILTVRVHVISVSCLFVILFL